MKSESKFALITGSAQGIGAEIARCFAARGYFVLMTDYNEELGREEERKLAGKAKFFPCDLSIPIQVEHLAASIAKDFPVLDTIVHNAKAPAKEKDLLQNLDREWDLGFQVMLKHPILLTHLLLDCLKASQNPSILYIGSTNSRFISQQPLSYHVVKGALWQTVRYLASEYAEHQIRVNLLNPGIVDVPGRAKKNPELFQRLVESVVPLKRTALAKEVGDCALFFASNEAKYLTGTSLDLDGGEHLKDPFHLMMSNLKTQEMALK